MFVPFVSWKVYDKKHTLFYKLVPPFVSGLVGCCVKHLVYYLPCHASFLF